MKDKTFDYVDSFNLSAGVKRGLIQEMLHHKQVTQVQFDQLMELQRGR